jgi:hypothetical protein
LRLYLKWKRQKFYKKPSLRINQNGFLFLQMNLGYNESAFVTQILPQLGFQNLRNWTRPHVQYNTATYYQQFPSQLYV